MSPVLPVENFFKRTKRSVQNKIQKVCKTMQHMLIAPQFDRIGLTWQYETGTKPHLSLRAVHSSPPSQWNRSTCKTKGTTMRWRKLQLDSFTKQITTVTTPIFPGHMVTNMASKFEWNQSGIIEIPRKSRLRSLRLYNDKQVAVKNKDNYLEGIAELWEVETIISLAARGLGTMGTRRHLYRVSWAKKNKLV